MKKLNSLKLNQLSKTELEKREMGLLKGGTCACVGGCGCSCAYQGSQSSSSDSYYGGSSVSANQTANANLPSSTNSSSVHG